jgi:hypothetical protein
MLLTIRRRSQVSLFLARVGRTCTLAAEQIGASAPGSSPILLLGFGSWAKKSCWRAAPQNALGASLLVCIEAWRMNQEHQQEVRHSRRVVGNL